MIAFLAVLGLLAACSVLCVVAGLLDAPASTAERAARDAAEYDAAFAAAAGIELPVWDEPGWQR